MGVVYQVREISTGEIYALKVLLDAQKARLQRQARFQREIEALRALRHPRIVTLHDSGWDEEYPYFVMDYVEGMTLREWLQKSPLDREMGVRIVADCLDGLDHAHRLGLVHRDLKPENILIDPEGNAHLTDFGLVKAIDENQSLTRTGAVVGTPFYVAPEIIQGQGELGTRSDLFSMGVILYEILSEGKRPFGGGAIVQIYHQILRQTPAPPTRRTRVESRVLDGICMRSVEKIASRRYPSADEFSKSLREVLGASRPLSRLGDENSPRYQIPNSLMYGGVLFTPLLFVLLWLFFGNDPEGAVLSEDATVTVEVRKANSLRTRARQKALSGRHNAALTLLRESERLDPKDRSSYVQQIYSLRSIGKYEEAAKVLSRWKPVSSDEVRYAITEGLIQSDRGHFEQSIVAYSRALAIDPLHAMALSKRAEAYRSLGQVDLYLEDRTRCREILDSGLRRRFATSRKLLEDGQWEEAHRLLEEWVEIEPKSVDAQFLIGWARERLGDRLGALLAWDRVLENDPKNIQVRLGRARYWIEIGQLQNAEEDLSAIRSIKADPSARFLRLSAQLSQRLGWNEKALISYQRLENLFGLSSQERMQRAKVLIKNKKREEALLDIEHVLQQDQSSGEAYFLRGSLLGALGQQIPRAIKDLVKAYELGFTDLDRLGLAKAQIARKENDPEKAWSILSEIQASGNESVELHIAMAEIARELENPREGLHFVQRAVESEPYVASHLRLRGFLKLDLGMTDSALSDFHNARKLRGGDLESIVGLFEGYVSLGRIEEVLGFEKEIRGDIDRMRIEMRGLGTMTPVELRRRYLIDPRRASLTGKKDQRPRLIVSPNEYRWAIFHPDQAIRVAGLQALERLGKKGLVWLKSALGAAKDGGGVSDEVDRELTRWMRRKTREGWAEMLVRIHHAEGDELRVALRKDPSTWIPRLGEVLRDPDETAEIRGLAAHSLAGFKSPSALKLLGDVMRDEDPFGSLHAFGALWGAGYPVHASVALKKVKHSDAAVRSLAMQNIPSQLFSPDALRKLLQDPVEEIRVLGAIAMAFRGDWGGESVLVHAVEGTSQRLNKLGLLGLGAIKNMRSRDLLGRTLRHPAKLVRQAAMLSLVQQTLDGARQLPSDVLEAIRHYREKGWDLEDRVFSVYVLVRCLPSSELEFVRALARGESGAKGLERAVAIRGLIERGDPSLFLYAKKLLEDPERLVRVISLLGIGVGLPGFHTDRIFDNVKNSDSLIRAASCLALSRTPGEGVKETLLHHLNDPATIVSSAAAASLIGQFYRRTLVVSDIQKKVLRLPLENRRVVLESIWSLLSIGKHEIRMSDGSRPNANQRILLEVEMLEWAQKWVPDSVRVAIELANRLKSLRAVTKARGVLEVALRETPESLDLKIAHLSLLIGLGSVHKAQEALVQLLKQFPDDCRVWYWKGMLSRIQRNETEARSSFLQSFRLAPEKSLAVRALCQGLQPTQKDRKYWEYVLQIGVRRPEWGRVHWDLAIWRIRTGERSQALEHLKKVAKCRWPVPAEAKEWPEFESIRNEKIFQSLFRKGKRRKPNR
jgi:serine/threonine protein kinase/HEAT repeat protein